MTSDAEVGAMRPNPIWLPTWANVPRTPPQEIAEKFSNRDWRLTSVDQIAIVMLAVVIFVALMVQVYSTGYMKGDSRYGWYFTAMSLFAASMLTLVLVILILVLEQIKSITLKKVELITILRRYIKQ